jgi:cell division transport system permease protein
MRAIDYSIRQGWASLWRSRGSTAFAILAIALATIVLGVLLLLTWNAQRLLERWSSAAEFSVYLSDTATSEERGAIEAALDQSGVADGREYVSKAQALTRFRQEFAELASLTTSFGDNPFPASLEVRVRPQAEADGSAEQLVRRVATMAGVADVRYDREWLSRVSSALQTVRASGLGLALLMAVAAGMTVATVVRLGLHARRAELEIMELVGAPLTFIRGPFIAEGLLQGGLGALVAMLVLWAGFAMALGWWGTEIRGLLDGDSLDFLPVTLVVYLLLGGMAVGAAGGFAAALTAAQHDS